MDENRKFVGRLGMHVSDSTEQRKVEQFAVEALSLVLGVDLKPRVIQLGNVRVQIDGCSANQCTMAEVYSGIGAPKPGQVKKVIADAFKLISVESFLHQSIDKYLCLVDAKSYDYFTRNYWYSKGFEAFGIKTVLIELPVEIAEMVKAVKSRQGYLFRKG